MPFFERNSFVLRQLLQPGWVNRTNWLFMFSIVMSPRNERLNCAEPINRNSGCQLTNVVSVTRTSQGLRTRVGKGSKH